MFDEPFLLIGHRGAAGLEPENTLRSFLRAAEFGVAAVELDVRACGGQLVVLHDDRVDRTTNGKGALADFTLEALRALDAGQGERIPLLAEVFAALPHEIGINVELKDHGLAGPLLDFLAGADDRAVLVSSFYHDELKALRRLRPDIRIAPLFQRQSRTMLAVAEAVDAWAVNINRQMTSRELIDEAHEAGLRVLVYTVNDAGEAERLRDWGVDGLFTDRPDLVR
jgi:glycerophosphoryl diester phosphodiesterase